MPPLNIVFPKKEDAHFVSEAAYLRAKGNAEQFANDAFERLNNIAGMAAENEGAQAEAPQNGQETDPTYSAVLAKLRERALREVSPEEAARIAADLDAVPGEYDNDKIIAARNKAAAEDKLRASDAGKLWYAMYSLPLIKSELEAAATAEGKESAKANALANFCADFNDLTEYKDPENSEKSLSLRDILYRYILAKGYELLEEEDIHCAADLCTAFGQIAMDAKLINAESEYLDAEKAMSDARKKIEDNAKDISYTLAVCEALELPADPDDEAQREAVIGKYKGALEQQQKALKDFEETITSRDESKNIFRQYIEHKYTKIPAEEQKIGKYNDEIARVRDQIRANEASIAKLRKQIEKGEGLMKSMPPGIKAYESKFAELEKLEKELEAMKEESKGQISRLAEEENELLKAWRTKEDLVEQQINATPEFKAINEQENAIRNQAGVLDGFRKSYDAFCAKSTKENFESFIAAAEKAFTSKDDVRYLKNLRKSVSKNVAAYVKAKPGSSEMGAYVEMAGKVNDDFAKRAREERSRIDKQLTDFYTSSQLNKDYWTLTNLLKGEAAEAEKAYRKAGDARRKLILDHSSGEALSSKEQQISGMRQAMVAEYKGLIKEIGIKPDEYLDKAPATGIPAAKFREAAFGKYFEKGMKGAIGQINEKIEKENKEIREKNGKIEKISGMIEKSNASIAESRQFVKENDPDALDLRWHRLIYAVAEADCNAYVASGVLGREGSLEKDRKERAQALGQAAQAIEKKIPANPIRDELLADLIWYDEHQADQKLFLHSNTQVFRDMVNAIKPALEAVRDDAPVSDIVAALKTLRTNTDTYVATRKRDIMVFNTNMRKARMQFADGLSKKLDTAIRVLEEKVPGLGGPEAIENNRQFLKDQTAKDDAAKYVAELAQNREVIEMHKKNFLQDHDGSKMTVTSKHESEATRETMIRKMKAMDKEMAKTMQNAAKSSRAKANDESVPVI